MTCQEWQKWESLTNFFLEDMTERENVGVLVVDNRILLKHCRETGHNDVIFVNIGSF